MLVFLALKAVKRGELTVNPSLGWSLDGGDARPFQLCNSPYCATSITAYLGWSIEKNGVLLLYRPSLSTETIEWSLL